MGKKLKEIWILTETGTVVFHRAFGEQMNPQIFGMVMSAIDSFAKGLTKQGISKFELSEQRFEILKRSNFMFITRSSLKSKPKKVIEALTEVGDKFFELYGERLYNWDGDVSIFEDFEDHISES